MPSRWKPARSSTACERRLAGSAPARSAPSRGPPAATCKQPHGAGHRHRARGPTGRASSRSRSAARRRPSRSRRRCRGRRRRRRRRRRAAAPGPAQPRADAFAESLACRREVVVLGHPRPALDLGVPARPPTIRSGGRRRCGSGSRTTPSSIPPIGKRKGGSMAATPAAQAGCGAVGALGDELGDVDHDPVQVEVLGRVDAGDAGARSACARRRPGMIPPTITGASTPCLADQLDDPRDELAVGAGEDREPDDVDVLLRRREAAISSGVRRMPW